MSRHTREVIWSAAVRSRRTHFCGIRLHLHRRLLAAPGLSLLGTWETTNLKARMRQLAPPQVVGPTAGGLWYTFSHASQTAVRARFFLPHPAHLFPGPSHQRKPRCA